MEHLTAVTPHLEILPTPKTPWKMPEIKVFSMAELTENTVLLGSDGSAGAAS